MILAFAKAKLNIGLNLTGRRSDGYHLLDTVMQQVWICDMLTFRRQQGERVEITGGPPMEENLVWKAASLYRAHYGITDGLSVQLDKRIPMGAGMGGGSSDAATTLVALDAFYRNHTSLQQLTEWAVSLGADVPFGLTGGTARVTGIGEKVEPMPNTPMLYGVAVQSACSLSTPAVYKAYDALGAAASGKKADISAILAALQERNPEQLGKLLHNDLEAAAGSLSPSVQEVAEALLSTDPLGVQMTGSGSVLFALYRNGDRALRAANALRPSYPFVQSFTTAPAGVPMLFYPEPSRY